MVVSHQNTHLKIIFYKFHCVWVATLEYCIQHDDMRSRSHISAEVACTCLASTPVITPRAQRLCSHRSPGCWSPGHTCLPKPRYTYSIVTLLQERKRCISDLVTAKGCGEIESEERSKDGNRLTPDDFARRGHKPQIADVDFDHRSLCDDSHRRVHGAVGVLLDANDVEMEGGLQLGVCNMGLTEKQGGAYMSHFFHKSQQGVSESAQH